MGLEPTTFAVTGRRCNQLNYTPAFYKRDISQLWELQLFYFGGIVNADCYEK